MPPAAKSNVSVRGAARAASAPNVRTKAIRVILIFSEYSFLFLQRSHGRHIGNRKRRQILVLGHGSESEPPHLDAESAATRVVRDLRDAVLQRRSAIIVNRRDGRIPAFAVVIAIAECGAELIGDGRNIRVGMNLIAARRDEVAVYRTFTDADC